MNLRGAAVVLRADASFSIGTGHVVRMLTLADLLRERGARAWFVSRPGPGDMLAAIRSRGHAVIALPEGPAADITPEALQDQDAAQTRASLPTAHIDLLGCDHYGLDHRWHTALRSRATRLLAVDDLARRRHDCDVLLDQNLGHSGEDYAALVPAGCRRLVGPAYALLRPQFARARTRALARRAGHRPVQRVLVSLGGADLPNATCRVLESLAAVDSLQHLQVDVVMGAGAPWLDEVRSRAASAAQQVRVHVGVADMAELMLDSDFAIGAGGGSAWERCCLALPTLIVVIADNQRSGAQALVEAGAACVIGGIEAVAAGLGPMVAELCSDPSRLHAMALAAAGITDGQGATRVVDQLELL